MNLFKSIFILLISITMTQCGSSQHVLQEASFDGGNSYFQKWIAGVQGGGSGVNLFLDFQDVPSDVVFEKAYFKGMVTEIKLEGGSYVARFKTALNNSRDLVMSDNPVEEMVNTPSGAKEFKFPLDSNDTGITFLKNGVLQFAKITNITEKESVPMPSQRPQNGLNKG